MRWSGSADRFLAHCTVCVELCFSLGGGYIYIFFYFIYFFLFFKHPYWADRLGLRLCVHVVLRADVRARPGIPPLEASPSSAFSAGVSASERWR